MSLSPAVLEAIEQGRWVVVCDRAAVPVLEKLGKTATVSPNGDSHLFKGAKVAILTGSGRAAIDRALADACELDPIVKDLKVYQPPEGHGTVVEFLEAGGNLRSLRPFDQAAESAAEKPEAPRHMDPDTGEVLAARCDACASHIVALQDAKLKLRQAEYDLRGKRAELTRLREEMAPGPDDSPQGRLISAIGRYWIVRTGRGERKVPPKMAKKRVKAVAGRLREGYPPVYICRAIDWNADHPFVDDRGTTHNDIELVCRDEVRLERYHDDAVRTKTPTLLNAMWVREFGSDAREKQAPTRSLKEVAPALPAPSEIPPGPRRESGGGW